MRNGIRTTEHAIVCLLILLAVYLLCRGHTSTEIFQTLSGPSFAGGMYALGRGIAKGFGARPFGVDLADLIRREQTGMTGRVANPPMSRVPVSRPPSNTPASPSSRTGPAPAGAAAREN